MTRDPYTVLGLTPGANNDEVKAAYRKLAKQYHPDLNPGSTEAEKKMKEINEAYDIIVNGRYQAGSYGADTRNSGGYGAGTYSSGAYSSSASGGAGAYGGAYRRGYADPFEGFWNNPFGSTTGRAYSKNGGAESSQLRAARNYINSRHFNEALNVLESIRDRDAYWYYLSALANEGVGNHINALEHIKIATSMEPDNQVFDELRQRLEFSGARGNYSRNFNMPRATWSSALFCLFLNLCCGRRWYC